WTVPTLALWETFLTGDSAALAGLAELRYVPATWRVNWARQLANIRSNNAGTPGSATVALRGRILLALQRAGCPIAFGTDSPQLYSVPGFSTHREMRSMAAAGLTPPQILTAATRNVARYFGAEREFGTVAPGLRADLLLLEANPLADIGNVARRAGVMVAGRWIPETEIQGRLERMAAGYR
ncbi:MAG: amidohydrolase family protein, partial [Gemmatimonadales bacterium]